MYQTQDFSQLLGLAGFSDRALETHFTLYEGYVTNVNKLNDLLAGMVGTEKASTPEYAELKRRLGWEFDGMRLHEYYFASLTKEASVLDPESALYQKMATDFGSYENWEKDFRATASSRGIGWAILYHDPVADRLYNVWVNEHDAGHLAGGRVILPLDVFEHAFVMDYGTKRADYITAFLSALDWPVISQRLSL